MADDAVSRRVAELEARLGKRIILRGVRLPDRNLRGRLTERPGHFLLEYRDDLPGWFWAHDIIRELLDCLEQGQTDVTLVDANDEGTP